MTKVLRDERVALGPNGTTLRHQRIHVDDARRWKRARKRRGSAGRKGEPRRVVEIEIAVDFAGQAASVSEMQQLKVLDFMNDRWIMDRHLLIVPMIVG